MRRRATPALRIALALLVANELRGVIVAALLIKSGAAAVLFAFLLHH